MDRWEEMGEPPIKIEARLNDSWMGVLGDLEGTRYSNLERIPSQTPESAYHSTTPSKEESRYFEVRTGR